MEFEELEEQAKEALKAAKAADDKNKRSVAGGGMSLRERFQRVIHYQTCEVPPNFEFGYWNETLGEWRKAGLPDWVQNEKAAYEYFGIENYQVHHCEIGVGKMFVPAILEETEDKIVQRDSIGVVSEINRKGHRSIPHFLDHPIKDRETWRPYKEYLLREPADPNPEVWARMVEGWRGRDYPLGIHFGSLIGVARNLMGFERTALMVYEDPELIMEIVETFCANSIRHIEKVLPLVQFDFAAGWEDICFNSGPIVGVPFFNEVLAPHYRRITELLNLHGVDLINTDCDGNISQVVPAFLAGGINTMFPVERREQLG
jgi:uroporphyrinogen decarboxylase